MKEAYAWFYVQGREDRLVRNDIDTEQLAQDVLAGKGSLYEVAHKAALTACEPLRVDRKKRAFLEEYADEITGAGGDGEEAYQHYIDGRVDQLCASLEDEAFDDLAELVSDDDGEDDKEGGDEDDEEEDEEDEKEH